MSLTPEQKKKYRTIGHDLKPLVIVGENGISEGVSEEIQRALFDHELIKIKISVGDREDKKLIIEHILQQTRAELVQSIGKTILILKHNPNAKAKLSNLKRYSS